MSLGWFDDLDDANDYFKLERLETWAWDELEDIYREKVVNTAYNRLYYDPKKNLPTYTEALGTSGHDKLKKANGEMAYYLCQHLADEDRRKGMQAQGVTEAGRVAEKYSEKMFTELPVPPFVEALLSEWSTEKHFGAIDLERDEEESVNTKVHDF